MSDMATADLPARIEEGRPVSSTRTWLSPPATLAEALELARVLATSTFVPAGYRGKPGDVLCAIQFGAEIGVAPLQALQGIAVIGGRPAVFGDLAMALVEASGKLADKQEWIEGEGAAMTAVCRLHRRGRSEPCERRFAVADATAAGLWGKEGPWRTYPRRMLQMRARAFALRDEFADALKGLAIAEEVQDLAAPAADVIPPPRRLAAAPIPSGTSAAPIATPATDPPPSDASAANESGGASDPDAIIPEADRRHLIGECKNHGRTFDQLKAWVVEHGVGSTTAIPRRLYPEALAWAIGTDAAPASEPGADG